MKMDKYWKIVWDMVDESDVVLEVVDARYPSICRSNRLEKRIMGMEKCNLLIALNKADLVPPEHLNEWINWLNDHENIKAIGVSATKRLSTSRLRAMILKQSRRKKANVAVVGLPNTGKSSLINALSGRKAASVAPISGHTKGQQKVNVSNSITMFDTPGIIPVRLPEMHKHLLGVIPITKLKDPIGAAYNLYLQFNEMKPGALASHYDVDNDQLLFFENLAIKMNKLKKGGLPDERAAAIELLRDHIRGRIPIFEDINNPLRLK
ncbi:MAG: 50S ribosome-binding GTPase [Candidatus Heimdallarchaeota archaeon]|nr:50S ribosome-binding GTPase [Candidatus Heimdallarchaeota archaeon]